VIGFCASLDRVLPSIVCWSSSAPAPQLKPDWQDRYSRYSANSARTRLASSLLTTSLPPLGATSYPKHRDPSHPFALLPRRCHFVARAFGNDFALKLCIMVELHIMRIMRSTGLCKAPAPKWPWGLHFVEV